MHISILHYLQECEGVKRMLIIIRRITKRNEIAVTITFHHLKKKACRKGTQ